MDDGRIKMYRTIQHGFVVSALTLVTCIVCIPGVTALSQTKEGAGMPVHVSGPFEVKLTPQEDKTDPGISRMVIAKQFHGDLEATSAGTMLAAGTAVKGSAGYVAIEVVTGTLKGHHGTFVLQHSGTMTRGAPQLSITVVPDSGTDGLVGLTGKMTIDIAEGKHSYDFEYTLPEATK